MSAALSSISPAARRIAYAVAAAALLGGGEGLERGQLHARAVPLYNVVHRVAGPVALAALVALGVLPLGFLVGALAWGFHVTLDRALGYGLRTRDGFQRR